MNVLGTQTNFALDGVVIDMRSCRPARFAVLFCSLLVLSLSGAAEQELTLDQLIERNVKTMGGRAAIEAVQSIKFDLHIVDPGFEVDAVYYAARPGRMRIDINAAGKHVYTEAFNASRGWQWKGKGDLVDESETATSALRHGVELPDKLFGLHELRQRGNKLKLVRRETVENVNYYVLRLTFSDGATTALYLDPDTWLITRRRDVRPLHPDIDPTPTTIETTMTDFRKVGHLRFPFASTNKDLKTGKVLEQTTTRDITLNPPISRALFEALELPKL